MRIYASTTFLGETQTRLADPLAMLAELDLDGVELGSTHVWELDLAEQIGRIWRKPILTHNYFPPAHEDIVLNIASDDKDVRRLSIEHMRTCLRFAADIGANLYTVHPGFLANAYKGKANTVEKSFDFAFSKEKTPYDRAFGLMVDALADLSSMARSLGVRLAIETEGSLTSSGVTLMEEPQEYDRLFAAIDDDLYITLNVAHTSLAAKGRGFDMAAFLRRYRDRIAAIELSHNDGFRDQHLPLQEDSPSLDWLPRLPDVPVILEFRCATQQNVKESIALLRKFEKESV